jgi:hypothetical protein
VASRHVRWSRAFSIFELAQPRAEANLVGGGGGERPFLVRVMRHELTPPPPGTKCTKWQSSLQTSTRLTDGLLSPRFASDFFSLKILFHYLLSIF